MQQHPLADQTCVSLDLETTGLDPDTDRIIEIGAVKFRGETTVDTFQSFVNPGRVLPYRIRVLCGIAQSDVDAAPPFRELNPSLRSFIGDCPVVGHNVPFDLAFLEANACALPNPTYDTYEIATLFLFQQADYSLSTLTTALGLSAPEHRALADAMAAKDLFNTLVRRGNDLDIPTLEELTRLAQRTRWGLAPFFAGILHSKARTAFTDQPLPPAVSGDIKLWQKSRDRGRSSVAARTPLDIEELEHILEPGGPLAGAFPGYEHRREQVAMMEAVAGALNDSAHLIVEAGTGVGKSIAYLLPAVFFSASNDVPVVISTNTINLQDQLMGKDIPDLLRALKLHGEALQKEVTAVQLKGRTNYLCRTRYEALRRSDRLSVDEARLLARVMIWLRSTQTGDRSELSLFGSESRLWGKICTQSDERVEARCPHRDRGTCFLHQARRAAETAHLIVVNHALLLSDLVAEGAILPPYDHLIIDEAHHLEDEATSQFGFNVDQWELLDFLGRFRRESHADRPAGLLPDVNDCFRGSSVNRSRQRQTREAAESLDRFVQAAHVQLPQFLGALRDFVDNHATDRGDYERHLRITPGTRAQPGWSRLEILWEDLGLLLGDILTGLDQLYTSLEDLADANVAGYDRLMTEVPSLVALGSDLRFQTGSLVSEPEADTIYWLSCNQQTGAVGLHAAPLNVGAVLDKSVFGAKECAILTGATLSTEGTFEFLKGRLGLLDAREVMLESPFDYVSSTMLYLPEDIPDPSRPGYQDGVQHVLLDICRAARGRTLALFTSHAALRTTQAAIQDSLEEEGIIVLGQGVNGSPRQLVAALKGNPDTALLGAASLWEGVDIAGDALSVLVIARLPFNVPTEPVFAARCEMYDDPFNEYGIPQAAIRFKQGFGRLIRGKSDRGVVVVLDRRVQSKKYGAAFLESIPLCTVIRGPSPGLGDAIRGWLQRGESTAMTGTPRPSRARG